MRRRWAPVATTAALGLAAALWCLHIPTQLDALWPWPPLARGSLAGWIVVVWAAVLQPVTAYLAMVVLGIVVARRRWRDMAGSLLLSIVLTVSFVTIAKSMVARARPDTPWLGNLHADASFPSGHSAAAFALAIAVAQTAWTLTRSRRATTVTAAIGGVTAAAVAVGRLLLDVHHVSDVLGGAVIAAFAASLATVVTGAWTTGMRPLPADGRRSRAITVIYHPHRARGLAGIQRRLAQEARRLGDREPVWRPTGPTGDGAALARAAIEEGAEFVIAVGGDGTLRQVMEAAAGRAEVALLPAGSANVIARNLGIPLDLVRAIDLALTGQGRPLDLMRIDVEAGAAEGESLLGAAMAGAGADAAVLGDTREPVKRLGGPLAYLTAGARHVRADGVSSRVVVDGQEWRGETSLVSVGNVGSLYPGVTLMGSADASDGRLEVLVASPRSRIDVVRMMLGVLLGRSALGHVTRFSGRQVSLSFDSPVAFQVDGEVVGSVTSVTVVVLPAAASLVRS